MNILEILGSIDWLFAGILLIAGRYWGGKFFTVTKNPALNFLIFATLFGAIWIGISYMIDRSKVNFAGLFVTYLFTTSFYELLAKQLFERIENLFPKNKENEKTN